MMRRGTLVLLVVLFGLLGTQSVESARRVEIDVILLVDTSDSMSDELQALCNGLDGVVGSVAQYGIEAKAVVLGIAETRACAGDQVTHLIPDGEVGDEEDWGLAVADLARAYAWRANAIRLIIPVSDEGPLGGDPVDEADERATVAAISAARNNDVIVSPMLGTEFNAEVEPLARELAVNTQGEVFLVKGSTADLTHGLRRLIMAASEPARTVRTVLDAIPTPRDIEFSSQVISTNVVLAFLATLVVGVASAVTANTVEANRVAFRASRFGHLVVSAGNLVQAIERLLAPGVWSRLSGRPRRLLAVLQLALFLALISIIGVLLEPGLSPVSWRGLGLWLGMLFALALAHLTYEGVQYALAQRAGSTPVLRLRPAIPLITLASVILSRVFGFLPGVFYGRVTNFHFQAETEEGDLPLERQARIVSAGLVSVGLTGLSLWVLTVPVSLLLDWIGKLDLPTTLGNILASFLGAVEGLLLLGFFLSLQVLLFELLPHPATGGGVIFRHSRLIWAGITFGVFYVLVYALLNPFGAFDSLANSGGLRLLVVFSFLYSALAVALWLLFALRGDSNTADGSRSQRTTVMAISLMAIWVLGACSGIVMFIAGLFD